MTDITTSHQIDIAAPPERVWEALTTPDQISKWFFGVDTESDWQVGSPLIHRGQRVTWTLEPIDDLTTLTVAEENLPSDEAKAISDKSWPQALRSLRELVER
jgi:uncharacterized protein YndB with AHSA1/START domain